MLLVMGLSLPAFSADNPESGSRGADDFLTRSATDQIADKIGQALEQPCNHDPVVFL